MPTVFYEQGFRFFFWSNENNEPIHIHVEKGDGDGKVWIEPVIKPAYFHNFSPKDQKAILNIIIIKSGTIKKKWNEYFSQ